MTVSIRSSYDEVRAAAEAIREHCAREGLAEMDAAMIELALVEALNNCVEHAYSGREDGAIDVSLRIDADRVEADVRDAGRAVDPAALAVEPEPGEAEPADRAALREGGRGLGIIRGVFDEVSFERAGETNHLHLVRRRTPR